MKPRAIVDDPLGFMQTTDDLIERAVEYQRFSPQGSKLLNDAAEPLKPRVFIDRCLRSHDRKDASVLVLAEKWIPQSSYAEVPLGPSVELITKQVANRPDFLQVRMARSSRFLRLEQQEFVEFSRRPREHRVTFRLDILDHAIGAELLTDSALQEMDQEVLGPMASTALSLATRLYTKDRDLFASGFEMTGPQHHYLLSFNELLQHAGTSTPVIRDHLGHLVPIRADSFPDGVWHLATPHNYSALLTAPSIEVRWTSKGIDLEFSRPLSFQAPGLREVENILAGADNLISDDHKQLMKLEPDELNDLIVEKLANGLPTPDAGQNAPIVN